MGESHGNRGLSEQQCEGMSTENHFGLNDILFKYIDDMLYTFRK